MPVNWLCSVTFLLRRDLSALHSLANDHTPLLSRHSPPATRRFSCLTPHQRVRVVRRPSRAGYCLSPTVELTKTERSPISMSGPFISVWHQTGRPIRAISFSSRSPPPDRWPLSRGRGRWTPLRKRPPPFSGQENVARFACQVTGGRSFLGPSCSRCALW